MRHASWLLGAAALAVAVWLACSWADRGSEGVAAEQSGKSGSGLPPLVVNKKAPLLLAEPPKKKTGEEFGPMADNDSCYVCHGDYREEQLVGWHAKENVGCVKCHGPSHAHRDDEDNVTPPDVMFAPEDIDPACVRCHEEHVAPARKVIATWQERCPNKKPGEMVCTDCHGHHRRPFRTVQWNKKTRELIIREEKPKPEKKSGD